MNFETKAATSQAEGADAVLRRRSKIKKIVSEWLLAASMSGAVGFNWLKEAYYSEKDKVVATQKVEAGNATLEHDEKLVHEILKDPAYKHLVESIGEPKIFAAMENALDMQRRYNAESAEERELDKWPEVDPIKTADGTMERSQVQSVLTNLPYGWVNHHLASVRYAEKEEGSKIENTKYKEDKGQPLKSLAEFRFGKTYETSTARFFKDAEENSASYIVESIDHEVSHGNDWEGNRYLTPKQRIALWEHVADRVTAKDRYQSFYVESITGNTQDINEERDKEYWAVICEVYFNRPEELNAKDFKIVDSIVKKGNPHYNVQEAAQANRALAEGMHQDHLLVQESEGNAEHQP